MGAVLDEDGVVGGSDDLAPGGVLVRVKVNGDGPHSGRDSGDGDLRDIHLDPDGVHSTPLPLPH